MSRYMQHLACRFHPDAVLIEDYRAGDMICPMCGLIVGERMIDVSSEWRDFGNESENKSTNRVGAAQSLLYETENLETTTSAGTRVGAFNDSSDKALRNGHSAIRVMAGRINLTKNVTDRAFIVFKECHKTKCLRGHSQDAVITTCIYAACRNEGSDRTMKEMCAISTVSVKELGRCFSKLKRLLPNLVASQLVEMKKLIPRFCNGLRLQPKQERSITKTAIHVAERANEICNVQGRQPNSIAGAAIYLTCLASCQNKTKKDIQEVTGASEGVIRDIYKIMLLDAANLFPEGFAFKCPIVNLPAI